MYQTAAAIQSSWSSVPPGKKYSRAANTGTTPKATTSIRLSSSPPNLACPVVPLKSRANLPSSMSASALPPMKAPVQLQSSRSAKCAAASEQRKERYDTRLGSVMKQKGEGFTQRNVGLAIEPVYGHSNS